MIEAADNISYCTSETTILAVASANYSGLLRDRFANESRAHLASPPKALRQEQRRSALANAVIQK
jgi:hypothetical protein